MKQIMIALFLSVALVGLSYAQSEAQNPSPGLNPGQQSSDPQSRTQAGQDTDRSQAGEDDTDLLVTGTVVTTNPETNQIVITDYTTGYDRTFTVTESDVLNNIDIGDTVQVKPEGGASDKASDVQKR